MTFNIIFLKNLNVTLGVERYFILKEKLNNKNKVKELFGIDNDW